MTTETIINEISAERERQQNADGHSHEHDDLYANGELAKAAACYAMSGSGMAYRNYTTIWWPWGMLSFTPLNPRRDLIRAAALIVAEIERLDRASQAGVDQ